MEDLRRQKIDLTKLPRALTHKWPGTTLDEGFVPLPKKLLRTLTTLFGSSEAMQDLAVLLAVVDYQRPDLKRHPSLEYLAFVAGLDLETTRRTLERLDEREWATTFAPDQRGGIEIDLGGFIRALRNAAERQDQAEE
ncbi:hypothetical protein [Sorangium sp. So ce341]|uniref:hypothetical protein n=1 Tax=Sorangium sp. So ce341 TaxID=3133302 RepID=UPI003F5ECE9F